MTPPTTFPVGEVVELERDRLCVPGGWDPLGLSVWDTSHGGLQRGHALEACDIPLAAAPQPVLALAGPPLDRLHLWLLYVERTDGAAAPPPLVRYELRLGGPALASVAVEALLHAAPPAPAQGSLVQLAGRLCTRWELWARVDPADGGSCGVRARFRALLDRAGSPRDGFRVVPWAPLTTVTRVQ
jgi:hypothetical protein